MTPATAFGKILHTRRRAASRSQKELAADAGLTKGFMSSMERGKRQPSITTVFLLATALGCDAEELLAETEARLEAAGTLTNREGWPRRTGVGAK